MKKGSPKVVILGSTGFTGSALMKEFRKVRDCRVVGYHSSDLDLASPLSADKLYEALDENTLLIIASRSRARDPLEGFSNEITIAKNVAQALMRCPIRKCVYFSSLSVYGDAETNLTINEATKCCPTSFYGIGKFSGESLLTLTAQGAGIPLLVFRPCKLYGPGDPSNAYGPTRFIESILKEDKVIIYGDGSELRDHLYVGDLLRITVEMALGGHIGTYNLASGESRSFQDILTVLKKISGTSFMIISTKRTKPKIDQKIDMSSLLEQMPGFKFTPLEQGLRDSYAFFASKSEGEYRNA